MAASIAYNHNSTVAFPQQPRGFGRSVAVAGNLETTVLLVAQCSHETAEVGRTSARHAPDFENQHA